MDYRVEDIEDQLIATLQASADLAGVNIRTHAGQININMFIDPKYYEGLVTQLPFIFIKYNGRTAVSRDTAGLINNHTLEFVLYVAATSLRSTQESQRTCYAMLRAVYDALHGKYPNSSAQTLISGITKLDGTQITTANFRALSTVLEAGGQDERMIIEMPTIAVYQTTYKIQIGT